MGENNSKETTGKELISKIYKQLIRLNTRKANKPKRNGNLFQRMQQEKGKYQRVQGLAC